MSGPARPAGLTATGLVWSATLLLPPGVSRDRYRQEFAAELYGRERGGPAGTSINSLFLPMSAGRPDH